VLRFDGMEKRARDMIGGGLRPNDPRRFLIEVMIGAMYADGTVDQRELDVLHKQLTDHDLFAGLNPRAAKTLIDLATDAVKFAGTSVARIPAMAKGLPARIHRMAGYAMACEVCAADEQIAPDEAQFLEALRVGLRVSPNDAHQIFDAAREKRVAHFLDDRVLRLRGMVPIVVEMFTLRAYARGTVTDDHRFALRDFFLAIPDLALRIDEIEGELFKAFRKPRVPGFNVFTELQTLAGQLPDPVDRYWLAVYAILAEPPDAVSSWRVIPFIGLCQHAFQIGDADMELAAHDALSFPSTIPRPT
jgi:Tellurite resistance protein TerB